MINAEREILLVQSFEYKLLDKNTKIGGEICTMRRVVIDMQSFMFADAAAKALRRFDPDYEVYSAENPVQTLDLCFGLLANVLVMEVTEYAPWDLTERMKLLKLLKPKLPECKIVFVVDENTSKLLADKVRQAKKDGLIDQFLYSSVSSDYLVAAIDAV